MAGTLDISDRMKTVNFLGQKSRSAFAYEKDVRYRMLCCVQELSCVLSCPFPSDEFDLLSCVLSARFIFRKHLSFDFDLIANPKLVALARD